MTDVASLLDGIEKRAARMARPDPTGMRIAPDTYITDDDRKAGEFNPIWFIVRDLRGLVDALRAVLDLHKMLPRPAWTGDPDDWCSQCDGQAYPCETVRAITEALGGGA